jgi:hypothetical protein
LCFAADIRRRLDGDAIVEEPGVVSRFTELTDPMSAVTHERVVDRLGADDLSVEEPVCHPPAEVPAWDMGVCDTWAYGMQTVEVPLKPSELFTLVPLLHPPELKR